MRGGVAVCLATVLVALAACAARAETTEPSPHHAGGVTSTFLQRNAPPVAPRTAKRATQKAPTHMLHHTSAAGSPHAQFVNNKLKAVLAAAPPSLHPLPATANGAKVLVAQDTTPMTPTTPSEPAGDDAGEGEGKGEEGEGGEHSEAEGEQHEGGQQEGGAGGEDKKSENEATLARQKRKIEELERKMGALQRQLDNKLMAQRDQQHNDTATRHERYDRGFELGYEKGFAQAFQTATQDTKAIYGFPGDTGQGQGQEGQGAPTGGVINPQGGDVAAFLASHVSVPPPPALSDALLQEDRVLGAPGDREFA